MQSTSSCRIFKALNKMLALIFSFSHFFVVFHSFLLSYSLALFWRFGAASLNDILRTPLGQGGEYTENSRKEAPKEGARNSA